MPPKHKIAHVITKLELGGAQQNTLYSTRHHDRNRFRVQLIAGRGGILDEEALAIPDAEVELEPTLRHPISPVGDLRAFLRLLRIMKQVRPDLVHTHSSKAGILGRAAARVAGVPVVVHTVHGWSFNETQPAWRRRLYVALERWAARRTDRLIVVSANNREKGLGLGIGRPEQYRVIHSGIDVEAFRRPERSRDEVRAKLGYDPSHRVVGTVACLKPQKAPLDFVEAAAAAHALDPRMRFFIAGDGPLMPELQAALERNGLREIVQLLGWRRDVVDLLHAMDLFLLTSLFEGLPRAVLQAMAAGVPVVATEVDGTPEVVEHERTGLLTPPGRPAEAAAAVVRLAGDDALRARCIEAAGRRLTRDFEIAQMVRDLDDLYSELLQAGPGHRLSGCKI